MARSSEHVEKMVGRRAATCLGWFLFLLMILMAIALVYSWVAPAESKPAPPAVEKR